MTKIETSLINMIKIVINFLLNHVSIIDAVPARAAARAELETRREALKPLEETAAANTTGVTRQTDALRLALCQTIDLLCGPLYSFAVATRNLALQTIAKTTVPKLERLKPEDLLLFGQSIYTELTNNEGALADYGITNKDISVLDDQLKKFDGADEEPREAINARAVATKALIREVKSINTFLKNTLDPLMKPLQKTEPAIYNGYLQARIVVEPPTNHTEIRGLIATFDDKPLYGVTITLDNGKLQVKVQTEEDGTYTARLTPDAGEWVLHAEKPGFLPEKQSGIFVQRGKTTKIDLTLKQA